MSGEMKTRPARKLRVVTKSDTLPLDPPARGLYIGGGGDLALIAYDDDTAVTLVGVPSGVVLPIETRFVMNTGTTASNIIALSG